MVNQYDDNEESTEEKFLDAGYTPEELTIVYSMKGETVQPAK
jgi:hypothetical protein